MDFPSAEGRCLDKGCPQTDTGDISSKLSDTRGSTDNFRNRRSKSQIDGISTTRSCITQDLLSRSLKRSKLRETHLTAKSDFVSLSPPQTASPFVRASCTAREQFCL